MFRRIYTVIVSFLLFSFAVWAQTGRISGKVTDSQTGDPLIGANVLILDTDYGAATDVNGAYLITNVPPGDYNLRASYIGYQDFTIQNIRVVTGLTQEVNFPLPSEAIATEEVVIVSERPLIEKSSTNAVRIIDSEDLKNLPVRNLNQIAALQPGVVLQNDLLTIRGSRPDETGYLVEGADVKNVMDRDGGALISVTTDAVQELLIQAGGYNAEFGGANAGIIQTNLRTGKESYHFSLRAETDNFGNYPGEKFLDTYSYGYQDLVVTVSGPVFTDKVKIFLSGENIFARDFNPSFFNGNPTAYSDGALFDTTRVFDTGARGGNPNDSEILSWQGGNLPGVFENRYIFTGTALIDLKPVIFKLSGTFGTRRERSTDLFDDLQIINLFNQGRYPVTDNSNMLLSLKSTYLLGDNMFIEGIVNYVDQRGKRYDPYFEDDLLAYSDSLQGAQFGWQYDDLYNAPQPYDFYGFAFNRPGSVLTTTYTKNENNYIGGSLAFTGQMQNHEVKVGGSYQYWTSRNYSVAGFGSLLRNFRQNPDNVRNTENLIAYIQEFNSSNFNNWGYDLFGNELDDESSPYAPKHPVFASGYIQDKFESDDLIINAGLRFDYIDMDSWAFTDPANPSYVDATKLVSDETLAEGSTYQYVTPRLGFSFPVTDRTVFHMQYGRFIQAPSLDLSFRGIHQATAQLIGGFAFTNPIGYDLEPQRTTQYEIGFSQQFTDFAAFDITAFYKDIRGLPVYAFQEVSAGSEVARYAVFTNQDFATTKGVELSLKIRRIQRVRAELNYTYTDARGTNSFATSGFGSVQVNNNVPTVIVPLEYDQTHRGSINLDYRFEKDDAGPILAQLGFNLLFTFNSGHPFTYAQPTGLGQQDAYLGTVIGVDSRQRRPAGPINSSTTPWVYNLDLRIDKSVPIFSLNVNFYIYVQNLLNTRNVINVYDHTGNGYDDGFLTSGDAQNIIAGSRYTERFADLYQAINLGNRQHYYESKHFDLFGTPRQLRAGVLIDF